MYDIQKVNIEDGDTLLFIIDDDMYDSEEYDNLLQKLISTLPNNKILLIPQDMVKDIKILSNLAPLTIPVANNDVNKNLSKINWADVGFNVGEMGI